MKKLIAAAVAAAVISPLSVTAAGPTLYGKLHMSIDMKDNNGDSDRTDKNRKYDEWSLSSNSSRIGVKGSEDLGNGMKVGYLIEWGVSMDGNGSDLNTRNRAVTLSGDWGTMLAGKWDTPMKTVGRKFDLFGDKIGDMRNLNTGSLLDQRAPNVVAYVTPNMNGLTATVAYVMSVNGIDDDGYSYGDTTDSDAWSFNAIYKNGPLMVGLGYVDYSDAVFNSTSSTCWTSSMVNNCENETAWRLGGSYKIGDFKVLATYTDISDAAGTDGKDTSIWSVGGSYTMGNNTIKVQYADRDEYDDWKDATGAKVVDSGKDTGADMWSIGLDHKMSKRTTVYAAYATTSNDDNSSSTSWGGGHDKTGNVGKDDMGNYEDADSFSVGIIHKF